MPSRPNLLVIQSDDHGQWASAPYGNSELHTPAMSEIARAGSRLDRAFTPSPVCSPARACFWTGKTPSAHGIHDHIAEDRPESAEHPGLDGQLTLAQRLHAVGYRTALAGKWHCHHTTDPQPGFDFWFAKWDHTTQPHFGTQTFCDQGRIVHHHGYQAPRITDAAMRFLREPRGDRPFFLYVGYTNTHSPFTGQPERLVQHYRRATFRDIPDERPDAVHGPGRNAQTRVPDDPAEHRERLAQYYAAVEMIDEQVGRLLDELDSQGLRENTVVVYTSDHGHMNGHHGLYCKGNATIPQNFLDESILVPCLIAWPAGGVGAGGVCGEPTDHCDLHATLADAAELPPPPDGEPRPGRSVLPLLRGRRVAWRDEQVCEYGNARMIRTDRHKLVRRYPAPLGRFPDELFDLRLDPRERVNRIDEPAYATVVRQLSDRLEEYFDRYGTAERSGLRTVDLPRHNHCEVWMMGQA